MRVGHRPGDDRRCGPVPAAGGGRGRGRGDPPGALGGRRRRLQHAHLRGGSAGVGLACGGAAVQGRDPVLPLHRPPRAAAQPPQAVRRSLRPPRPGCTTLADEKVDLYHAELHSKAWQCWLQVVYALPRGGDPQTKEGVLLYSTDTELAPECIFRFYGARFQIEFALRDAKQHLGLNDGQARSQAKLHFHFNIIFAVLFWARLQARLREERPLGPFSLHRLKRHNLEQEIRQIFASRSATGRNAAKSEAGRRRIPPERLWLRAPPLAAGPASP